MASEPINLAGILAKITGSSRGSDMAIRLYQSLEMTDGLWQLVPVVVAASEAHAQRPPAEVADSLSVATALASDRRARLRELGDTLSDIVATATSSNRSTKLPWRTSRLLKSSRTRSGLSAG